MVKDKKETAVKTTKDDTLQSNLRPFSVKVNGKIVTVEANSATEAAEKASKGDK